MPPKINTNAAKERRTDDDNGPAETSDAASAHTVDTPACAIQNQPTLTLPKEWADLFKCPVCYDYIIAPPILQCRKGHLVCSNCRLELNRCPICRGPLEDIRNLVMEKMASTIAFPCKFSSSGCRATILNTDKMQHEEDCQYRPYPCPYAYTTDKCQWQGSLEEFGPHQHFQHDQNIYKGETGCKRIHIRYLRDTLQTFITHHLFLCFGRLFILVLKREKDNFFASVQFIGTSKEAKMFTCKLELGKHSERITWETRPCSVLSLPIRQSDWCVIDTSRALLVAKNDKYLYCNLSISKM